MSVDLSCHLVRSPFALQQGLRFGGCRGAVCAAMGSRSSAVLCHPHDEGLGFNSGILYRSACFGQEAAHGSDPRSNRRVLSACRGSNSTQRLLGTVATLQSHMRVLAVTLNPRP